MKRNGMTINEAANEWVKEMNAIQWDIIDKLMTFEPEEWHEVTEPAYGDRVYCYEYEISGVIDAYDEENELYIIDLDNGKQVKVEKSDMEVEYDGILPMWGTMWSFGDSVDDWWLEEGEGIKLMSKCGFRIYEHEELGYFFGIDGAGYDFYEAHWIPLYKARGLHWHDESDELMHRYDELNLPTELTVNCYDINDCWDNLDENEKLDEISDYLTNEYEYCHDGFDFEEADNGDIHITDIKWDTTD